MLTATALISKELQILNPTSSRHETESGITLSEILLDFVASWNYVQQIDGWCRGCCRRHVMNDSCEWYSCTGRLLRRNTPTYCADDRSSKTVKRSWNISTHRGYAVLWAFADDGICTLTVFCWSIFRILSGRLITNFKVITKILLCFETWCCTTLWNIWHIMTSSGFVSWDILLQPS